MKILTQDRKTLMDMPKELWAAEVTHGMGMIVCSGRVHQYLGMYSTIGLAEDILKQIFDCYKHGEASYTMPEDGNLI